MSNKSRERNPYDPLNNSVSKMQFSFSKGARFESPTKFYKYFFNLLSDKYYDVPSAIGSGRKAGIGIGNKTMMCPNLNLQFPSPTKYTLESAFSLKSARGTKFSFGREELKLGGIFRDSLTPGPATYSIPSMIKEHTQITLKPRIKELSPCNLTNPGPGTYDVPQFINKKGIYALSKLRNSSVPSLIEHKTLCRKRKQQTPGPGSYDTKENISPKGSYFNAKFHDSMTRTFAKVQRKVFDAASNKLGPGSYNCYSEFG